MNNFEPFPQRSKLHRNFTFLDILNNFRKFNQRMDKIRSVLKSKEKVAVIRCERRLKKALNSVEDYIRGIELERALNLFQRFVELDLETERLLYNIRGNYNFYDNLEKNFKYYTNYLMLCEYFDKYEYAHRPLLHLGLISSKRNNNEEAKEYYFRSVERVHTFINTFHIKQVYSKLFDIFKSEKNYAAIIQECERLIHQFEYSDSKEDKKFVYSVIFPIIFESYTIEGSFELALNILPKEIPIHKIITAKVWSLFNQQLKERISYLYLVLNYEEIYRILTPILTPYITFNLQYSETYSRDDIAMCMLIILGISSLQLDKIASLDAYFRVDLLLLKLQSKWIGKYLRSIARYYISMSRLLINVNYGEALQQISDAIENWHLDSRYWKLYSDGLFLNNQFQLAMQVLLSSKIETNENQFLNANHRYIYFEDFNWEKSHLLYSSYQNIMKNRAVMFIFINDFESAKKVIEKLDENFSKFSSALLYYSIQDYSSALTLFFNSLQMDYSNVEKGIIYYYSAMTIWKLNKKYIKNGVNNLTINDDYNKKEENIKLNEYNEEYSEVEKIRIYFNKAIKKVGDENSCKIYLQMGNIIYGKEIKSMQR